MPIADSLATYLSEVAQCDNLIANAHKTDFNQDFYFSVRDREQITQAAFLNLFISWETYIEAAFIDYMTGDRTVTGLSPIRFVAPPDREHSNNMIKHINKYFDFSDHEKIRRLAKIYFRSGYPFETPIVSIVSELSDIKTIRNACAHFSSTTAVPLRALAGRIFGQPKPNISVYDLLTAQDPRIPGNVTVYASYKDKLVTSATLIANG